MISSSLAFSFFFLAHLALIHIFAQNVSIAEHEVLLNGKTRPWSIKSKTTIKSLIRQKRYHTLSSKVTLVPPYSGRRTFSPTFTLTGCKFPFCQEKHQQSSWLYYKMKKTCSRPSNTFIMFWPGWQIRARLPTLWPAALCLETSQAAWCRPWLPSPPWNVPPARGRTVAGIFWRPARRIE